MVTERFVPLAQAVSRGREVPDLPMVILPPDVEQMTVEELRPIARKALEEALERITAEHDDREAGAT
jgi:hypothetical protein